MIKPKISPEIAPTDEPLLQNNDPKKAGANCAMITNEIKPMETNE